MAMAILARFVFIVVTVISAAILSLSEENDFCKKRCPCENPASYTVYLPGPTKTKFYKCNYGVAILMNCGPGTEFDPLYQVCNWPTAVNAVACSKKPPNCIYEGSGNGNSSEEEEGSGGGSPISI